MPRNYWINRRQAMALGAMLVSVVIYNIGHYWENYTLTHSPNPRIDFNFGAAMLMMLGLGVGLYGIVQFLLGFRNSENIPASALDSDSDSKKAPTKAEVKTKSKKAGVND